MNALKAELEHMLSITLHFHSFVFPEDDVMYPVTFCSTKGI